MTYSSCGLGQQLSYRGDVGNYTKKISYAQTISARACKTSQSVYNQAHVASWRSNILQRGEKDEVSF